MTTALILLLASAILGLATGLFFRVWALLLVSPLIAVLAAIILRSYGFGFAGGMSVIVGCLVLSQLAYLLVAFHLHDGELSIQDEADDAPGEHGQHNVRNQHK